MADLAGLLCSSLLQLDPGACDFSQAEKRKTVM